MDGVRGGPGGGLAPMVVVPGDIRASTKQTLETLLVLGQEVEELGALS